MFNVRGRPGRRRGHATDTVSIQRLKGFNLDSFLDGKIAEEQAKQGKPAQSPSPARRTPSNAGPRRGSARTASPAQRGGSRLRVAEGGDGTVAGKGPDPEEFVIGDDASDISRAATPKPVKENTDGPVAEEGNADGKQSSGMPASKGKERAEGDELPEDVRKRLAKLESLTAKYQGTLSVYHNVLVVVSCLTHMIVFVQTCCATTGQRILACPPSSHSRPPFVNIPRLPP